MNGISKGDVWKIQLGKYLKYVVVKYSVLVASIFVCYQYHVALRVLRIVYINRLPLKEAVTLGLRLPPDLLHALHKVCGVYMCGLSRGYAR